MITYRLEKGAPLSILEIDNNFRGLEERLKKLEDKDFDGDLSVEQKEDVLIFKCGETVSHIVLPKFQRSMDSQLQLPNWLLGVLAAETLCLYGASYQ